MIEVSVTVGPGEQVTVFCCDVDPGDRFIVMYSAKGDCGTDLCKAPFRPCGVPVYIGAESLPVPLGQVATVVPNILQLDIPGVFSFSPDGVVSSDAKIMEVAREYSTQWRAHA